MRILKSLILIVCLLEVAPVWSHPVSFEGGAAIMTEVSESGRELSVVYSPRRWLGTGILTEKIAGDNFYQSLHLGLLVKRWNMPAAQGNLYVFGGPGYYKFDQTDETGSFMRLGAQADYETRKFYIAARYIERRSLEEDFGLFEDSFDFGIGFAPYVAGFSELNSWVIMKVRAGNRFEDLAYVPTLRFFYKNFLWEVGQSFKGETQLNFMVRY